MRCIQQTQILMVCSNEHFLFNICFIYSGHSFMILTYDTLQFRATVFNYSYYIVEKKLKTNDEEQDEFVYKCK